jgi:exodeoxyribonuclease VII large subunit
VLADLAAALADYERRLIACGSRAVGERRTRLAAAARGLPRPQELLEIASQRLDIAAGRLSAGLQRNVAVHAQALAGAAGRLNPRLLQREAELKGRRLAEVSARLAPAVRRRLQREDERLTALGKLTLSLNPKGPLKRGYALVYKGDGRLARSAAELKVGQAVRMEFQDGKRDAIVDAAPGRKRTAAAGRSGDQGDLF